MIKKIGSNKYGVVEYAISSVEDIADLPLGVAIGSTAVLINKDGIRTFALGEGEWVEYIDAERYDKNKLAQDLLFCGFENDGEKHDDLDDRLMVEFDEINERVNVGNYLEYNGRDVKADYSLEGLQRGVMLEGKTLQNLCDSDLFFNKNKWCNLTDKYYEFSNGYLTLTARGDYVNGFSFNNGMFKLNATYTLLLDIKENDLEAGFVIISDDVNYPSIINDTIRLDVGITGILKIVFVVNNTESISMLRSFISPRATSGHITSRYAIFEGDHTNTPFEELPFIEGIESVGDKSKNLFDGQTEEGQFGTTGQPSSSSIYIRTVNFIKVKPNTKYVLSYRNSDTRLGICEYDINKNFIKNLFDGNPKYFTTSETTQYLKFRVEKSTTDIQLEEGIYVTPYQEYYDGYKISGKSCGKNLIRNVMPKHQNVNGVDITVNDDGSVTFNGTASEESYVYINIDRDRGFEEIKSGYYTFSGINGDYNSLFAQLVISKNGTNSFINVFSDKIEISEDSKMRTLFVIRANKTFDNVTLYPQLEENNFKTPYEPYKELTYSYILDEPLRSLPNGVCDTIDLETGVLTRRVGKVVLNENRSWWISGGVDRGELSIEFATSINPLSTSNKMNLLCDKFYNTTIFKDGGQSICCTGKILYLVILKSNLTSLDSQGIKRWLQDNPTTVYYELAEPTIHQLDQNRIYSFKDTTHVTSDNLIAPRITTNILTNSNALISHLKGENLALANEVSTLSLRNRETQETNETQDHIIDASLCAVDELYMMYETTQEVEAMSTDEEGSRMVDMYVAMVQRGLKTIDQVPVRYRERVREILAQLED